MRSRSFVNIRRKITWGARAILSPILLLALTVVAPQRVDAAPNPNSAQPQPTQAQLKLDRELRGKAAQDAGETDVIVEFIDAGDHADVIRGFGKTGKHLAGMNGRAAAGIA